jgi:ankyrin repeat protein
MSSLTVPGPLFKAGEKAYNPDFSQKSLLKSSTQGSLDFVKELCEGGTWSLKNQSWGDAQWGRTEYTLDLNELNREDRVTPLIRAAEYGRLEVVNVLLQNGAAPNLQDRVLQTALHRAAGNGHLETCKALVSSRADPTLQDLTLRTPLDLAEINNHADVVALLRNTRNGIKGSPMGEIQLRPALREIPRQRYRRKYHRYGWGYAPVEDGVERTGSVKPLPRIYDNFDHGLSLRGTWSDSSLRHPKIQTQQRSGPI